MTPAYTAYKFLSSVVFGAVFPYYWIYANRPSRYRKNLPQRLGYYPPDALGPRPEAARVWMHAVSVGEVQAATTIIADLRDLVPQCQIILSSSTAHGYRLAQQRQLPDVTVVYAPIDFVLSVRGALKAFRPHVLACLETEIWPNLIIQAHRLGVNTAIVNGRISVRSIRRYVLVQRLMRETLAHIQAFSMIHGTDAQRMVQLGAAPDRISVNGNAKFDGLPAPQGDEVQAKMRQRYTLDPQVPVFLAGSTRTSEEAKVLSAYRQIVTQLPETVLIIAPRHVERARQIQKLVQDQGWDCQLRTELAAADQRRSASVVVLDTMGELQDTYSIASIVFCGGSLVPLGGQNILEPAAWGKPVLYGPSMDDFPDAQHMLEAAGGGVGVADEHELARVALRYLLDPRQGHAMGSRARAAALSCQGAAVRHARVIAKLLPAGVVSINAHRHRARLGPHGTVGPTALR
jgi:3-deoxy-D-manno-octulosonic-acid transferase